MADPVLTKTSRSIKLTNSFCNDIKIIEQRRIPFVHTATTNRWDEFNVPTLKKTNQTMKPNDHTLK